MERYRRAKLAMFEGVKFAVLNVGDSSYEYFKTMISGINPGAKILGYKESRTAILPPTLAGNYNRQNVAAAEMVARVLGIRNDVVRAALKDYPGIPGRRQEVKAGQNFRVIVDFAHTPNALEKVLMSLREELSKTGRLMVVFGATGERDEKKRPKMGRVASELADVAIVTSDDTRRESQDVIYSQIVAGVERKDKIFKENDRRKAIEKAVKMAKAGDILLLAGKGHEKTLLLGTVEHEWSDVDEAKRAIKGLGL
jgi:UDP-N-acetylmuramoyl-L-alanyl-D-glutamate--2,6-diaminopimelate ligase